MPPFSPRPTDNTIFYAPVSAPNTPQWVQNTTYQYEPFDPYSPSVLNDGTGAEAPLLNNRRNTTSLPTPGGPRPFRPSSRRPQYIPLQYSNFDDKPHDDDTKLRPIPSAVTDDSFLNTPSPSFIPHGPEYGRPRQHPFSSSYEPPDWKYIIIHVLLCLLAYPVLMIFTLVARDKTLFWTRLVVSCGCGVVGFCLGFSLINLGRALVEAASWATLIHQSRAENQPGIRLRDLAAASQDSTSALTAVRVLWSRWIRYSGTSRRQRRGYDPRYWSFYILFFLFLLIVAASCPFVLGRIVNITTSVKHQYLNYREVTVKGDLSDEDLARADVLKAEFNDYTITWTLSPFTEHGGLPPAVSFPWQDEAVYFSESIRSQFLPDGSGFGRLDGNTTAPTTETANTSVAMDQAATTVDPGSLIRYPRWGIRIHCQKTTNPDHIVMRSALNMTYLFTPRDTLRDLFQSFDRDLPQIFEQPLNLSRTLATGDNVTANFDDVALGAFFYDNGVAHSFKSTPIAMGTDGAGFVTLEAVLVRLNTSYTPHGTFLRYSEASIPDATGQETHIGYDAAICLELYEPWVVETYNSTYGSPSSTRIISHDGQVNNAVIAEKNLGSEIKDTKRQLNSSLMASIYEVAHGNSVNQLVKDNGRDSFYVPSPTVITFTVNNGGGSRSYTELSAEMFGQARALADATNVLPYFAGSEDIVGRSYEDLVLSDANIDWRLMVGFLGIILVLGLVAGLCVPKLPLGVPRRGFHVYSWLAAFHGGEVFGDVQRAGLEKNMELREIERRLGDLRFRYVI